eukprot:SAG11_NODE_2960_length_2809_cov_3.573063_2_plen_204_part_00
MDGNDRRARWEPHRSGGDRTGGPTGFSSAREVEEWECLAKPGVLLFVSLVFPSIILCALAGVSVFCFMSDSNVLMTFAPRALVQMIMAISAVFEAGQRTGNFCRGAGFKAGIRMWSKATIWWLMHRDSRMDGAKALQLPPPPLKTSTSGSEAAAKRTRQPMIYRLDSDKEFSFARAEQKPLLALPRQPPQQHRREQDIKCLIR